MVNISVYDDMLASCIISAITGSKFAIIIFIRSKPELLIYFFGWFREVDKDKHKYCIP